MPTIFKQVKNNAKTRVAVVDALNNTTTTSFAVVTGQGSRLPTIPAGAAPYWITIWDDSTYPNSPFDDPNMEIAIVTARSGDTLTIGRGSLTAAFAHPGTPGVRLLVEDQHFKDIHTAINRLEFEYDPRNYGAVWDNTADDTAAIQATFTAANAGGKGVVVLPVGIAKISAELTPYSSLKIRGQGMEISGIRQATANANGLRGDGLSSLVLEDFFLQGSTSGNTVGTGTGKGIYLTYGSNGNNPFHNFRNLMVRNFGSDGVYTQTAIVTSFQKVYSAYNGGNGFNQPEGGTSCSYTACWARGNAQAGYRWFTSVYQNISGCAADSNGIGYLVDSCQSIGFFGTGAESQLKKDATYNGYAWKITNSSVISIDGCWVTNNISDAIWITGGSNAIALRAADNSPGAGATSFIKTDTGTNVTIYELHNSTANSLTAGTYTLINPGDASVRAGDLYALNQTASTVPVFNANKALVSSATTPTELGYVSGVTSAIQAQLNARLQNITGLLSAGANVTITGAGTAASPYSISSSAGGGGGSTVTTTNMVNNPSFEVDLASWTQYGTRPGGIVRDTAAAQIGTASAKQDNGATTADGGFTSNVMNLSAGTWTFSFYVKLSSGVTNAAAVIRGAAGTTGVLFQQNLTYPGNTNFNRISGSFTVSTAGNYEILLGLGSYGAASAGAVNWDGILLEAGSSVNAYYDGSFTSTGDTTYAWTGTAHNSTSTKTYTPPVYVPDATSTSKGIIQLAGDLGGTAAAPTVPGLATKVDLSTAQTVGGTKTFASTIITATPTATLAPLRIPSGPVLTTAVAGTIENDGTIPYYTTSAAIRRAFILDSSTQTLLNKALQDTTTTVVNTADATKKIKFDASPQATGTTNTVQLPASSGTTVLLGTVATQTMTGKTIDGASNTISNVNPKVTRSNNGTTVTETASKVQTGWIAITTSTAATNYSVVLTFPTAFTGAPIGMASYGGDQTSGTATIGGGGNVVKGPVASKAYGETTTSMTLHIHSTDGTAWAVGNVLYIKWIAAGN